MKKLGDESKLQNDGSFHGRRLCFRGPCCSRGHRSWPQCLLKRVSINRIRDSQITLDVILLKGILGEIADGQTTSDGVA